MIESNRWGTEARILFTQEQGALLLTLLDCIVLFIMWKSQHGLEGKAKASSTSSDSHKIQSYRSSHQAELPGPPTLSFPWELPQHMCLMWEASPPCLQARPGVLHSVWVNPKDLLYQTGSTCPLLSHVQMCRALGCALQTPPSSGPGLTSAVL